MEDLFQVVNEPKGTSPVTIKVIGVGGCGGNAVEYICKNSELEVEFLCANTDLQALNSIEYGNNKLTFIQLGKELTGGKGAGAKPEVGRNAAIETEKEIEEELKSADMLFITAGMGGGTGTGASPIVANIAKKLGILTLAVVTTPFKFEAKLKQKAAEEGIKNLRDSVDCVILVPNEKILSVATEDLSVEQGYELSNDVLASAVKGISHIITEPGKRNIDFADVQTVMSNSGGLARMGVGTASGDNRLEKAIRMAMNNPLLSDVDIKQANGILVNLCTSSQKELTIKEFNSFSDLIENYASEDAMVIYGDTKDESLGDSVMITVVATGFEKPASNVLDKRDVFSKPVNSTLNRIQDMPNRSYTNLKKTSNGMHTGFSSTEEIYDVPAFVRKQGD